MGLDDFGDSVEVATFEQILEMDDDDEEREFSKGIVFGFFDQAAETFDKMEAAL
jgi:osomolarity two-component system, phosphorelay intermediate protein YPD1